MVSLVELQRWTEVGRQCLASLSAELLQQEAWLKVKGKISQLPQLCRPHYDFLFTKGIFFLYYVKQMYYEHQIDFICLEMRKLFSAFSWKKDCFVCFLDLLLAV